MRAVSFGLSVAALVLLSCNAIAADWRVEPLPDNAPLSTQSCVMSFGLKGQTGDTDVFLDDGTDDKAVANIKIAGKLFILHLVSQKTSGKDGADSSGVGAHFDRMFKDKTGAVATTSSVTVTKLHPEADSSELAGTLSVTYQGKTQKIAIEGGVAC